MVMIIFASPFLLLDVIDDRLYPHETPRQVCRDHHQHFDPFQDINQSDDGNTILAPRDLCYH